MTGSWDFELIWLILIIWLIWRPPHAPLVELAAADSVLRRFCLIIVAFIMFDALGCCLVLDLAGSRDP